LENSNKIIRGIALALGVVAISPVIVGAAYYLGATDRVSLAPECTPGLPTPTPSESSTGEPTPTPTPTESATPSPAPSTPDPLPTVTISPTGTPTATPTSSPTASPIPSPTPSPEPSPTPEIKCETTIGINYSAAKDAFHGRVVSGAEVCETGRKVKLLKARPGKDKAIGNDSINAEGKYSIGGFKSPQGTFYSKVKAKTVSTEDGTLLLCKGDRSQKIKKG
jgi:hypothetical protein